MKKPVIISADVIKKSLKGYNPAESEKFHSISAKLADKEFQKVIKETDYSKVILMSGGAASGKTEYVSEYLVNEEAIILDGTLLSFQGAEIKIRKAIKLNKNIEIHVVLPADLKTAFLVFLNRERKFSPLHFYKTHGSSRNTVLQIAFKYPDVPIKLIESEYIELKESGSMRFTEKSFSTNSQLIEYLSTIQYNEEEIKEIVLNDK
jgi:hypothetical protein